MISEEKLLSKNLVQLPYQNKLFFFVRNLYRFEIIITDKKTYLLSDLHHIIFDGLSRGLFMDTVSKAYSGENTEVEEICVCK